MRTTLQAITAKSNRQQDYRFRNLYRLINEENLFYAWSLLNKNSAVGVDKVTAREYGQNLKENIKNLADRLKKHSYQAMLVKRVYIPKSKDKVRPLGLPSLEDKLVQIVVAKILSAIFEPAFLSSSFGYRPDRGPQDAVLEMTDTLYGNRHNYVVEADIKGYFDSIEHGWLVKMLEEKIADVQFVRLIVKWLKAGILEPSGGVIHPLTGTPQGGIVSPVLANIYLHYALDLWFERVVKKRCEGKTYIIRFADDFVCSFQYKRDAQKFYGALPKRLEKFGLSVAPEKTRILSFSRYKPDGSTSFDFLGFEYRWVLNPKNQPVIRRRTSRKKLRASIQHFQQWCREHRNDRLKKFFDLVNAKFRGYYNYYGVIGNSLSLTQFHRIAEATMFKWLNRRSQRRSFNWTEFRRTLDRYVTVKPHVHQRNLPIQLRFK